MGFKSSWDLRIAEAHPRDISKGQCRLHPKSMEELDISAGDPIEITHDRGAVGSYCFPQDRRSGSSKQTGRDVIHIRLGSLLSGPEVDLTGHLVTVKKISPPDARKVTYEELPPGTHPEVAALVSKENLVDTLATTGARMALYGRRGSGIQGIMPMVTETIPDGIVKISENTDLEPDLNETG